MNSIVILPQEKISSNLALIVGERARYLIDFHELKQGLRVRAAEYNGLVGTALVQELGAQRVALELCLNEAPLPREPISVIAAVPRPQILKKVIQTASMMGVSSLYLVRTARVIKSYLQSKSLKAENITTEIIKGLEQSCTSLAPEVEIHRNLDAILQKRIAPLLATTPLLLAADTRNSATHISQVSLENTHRDIIIAIGPEAGWDQSELEILQRFGFLLINLGPRILRIEIALSSLIGQLSILRQRP